MHLVIPSILRYHCFHFLMGIAAALREIEDNDYAKLLGVNKVHYGLCENGEENIFLNMMNHREPLKPALKTLYLTHQSCKHQLSWSNDPPES